MGDVLFRMILDITWELILGYILFFVIGYLILLPGKDKLNNIIDDKENKERKKGIKKARAWICLGYTVLTIILNLLIYKE